MRIIPAIDIINGKCVRLTKGDYSQMKVYNQHPLEVAKEFEAFGIEYLHLVDLDGAKSKHIVNHKILNEICSKTSLKVDFGGGIKTDKDIEIAFDSGANQITCGTIASTNPELFEKWIRHYGKEKIILGADVQHNDVMINGWLDKSNINIIDFLEQYIKFGIQYVLCTDIEKDGMLGGSSIELYTQLIQVFPSIHLIASGGVNSMTDIQSLKQIGCESCVVGKAIYENNISLKEIADFMELENGA